MSDSVSTRLRRLVIRRAHEICEYCLIHQDDACFSFHIDHNQSRTLPFNGSHGLALRLVSDFFQRRKQRKRRSCAHYILKSSCFKCLPMPGLEIPPIDTLRFLLFKPLPLPPWRRFPSAMPFSPSSPLKTENCSPPTAHRPPPTAHCSLLTAHQ